MMIPHDTNHWINYCENINIPAIELMSLPIRWNYDIDENAVVRAGRKVDKAHVRHVINR